MRSATSAVGPWGPPHTKGFPPHSSLEIHSSSVDVGGACGGRGREAIKGRGAGDSCVPRGDSHRPGSR